MFKGIDTTRPWPRMGMTTEKWRQVPTFWVAIDRLIATQEGVNLHPLANPAKVSYSGDAIPHIVSWQGNLYLEDGHHRAIRALIEGKKEVYARVLTIIDHGE